MEKDQLSRKLAVILHADVVGSTSLVQQDEALAHKRIRNAFNHFSKTIAAYGGIAHEIRGDALVAEFERPSDAVTAAIAFQASNEKSNASIEDDIRPLLRIGISLGEVIIDDNTITGAGVVLAQRLEQLARPGGVVVKGAVSETVPDRLPFVFKSLGEQSLKGFDQPVRAFAVEFKPGESIPAPDVKRNRGSLTSKTTSRDKIFLVTGTIVIALTIAGVLWQSFYKEPPGANYSTGIAIRPLEKLCDASDDNIGYGLAEDIGTALSRFADLLVYPGNVTKRIPQAENNCAEIATALDADYILEGTVLRSGNVLRATVLLLDANDCIQIWSESYDQPVSPSTDIFSIRDDIASHVAASIGSPRKHPIWKSEKEKRAQTPGIENLDPYACILQSMTRLAILEESHLKSRECLEHAVEQDPDYAQAQAWLGFIYVQSYRYKYKHVRPKPLERAYFHIQRALKLNPKNQRALYTLALYHYLTDFTGFESFYLAAEAAIEVNPNNLEVLADMGNHITYSGKWERGVALSERARELYPNHPNWMYYPSFLDLYRREKYQEALALMLKINAPNNYVLQTNLAAVYGQLGEIEEAKETIEHIRKLHPAFDSDSRAPFVTRRMPADFIESIMDGLRKAGYDVPPAKIE
jgi:adenylate cyclase